MCGQQAPRKLVQRELKCLEDKGSPDPPSLLPKSCRVPGGPPSWDHPQAHPLLSGPSSPLFLHLKRRCPPAPLPESELGRIPPQPWVGGLLLSKPGGLCPREEKPGKEEPSSQKHVLSVYRGAYPAPRFVLFSGAKKKKPGAASSPRPVWRLKNVDCCGHTALGLELAWAGAPTLPAAEIQHPPTFLCQPRKPRGQPPREAVGGGERQGASVWLGFGFLNTEPVCVSWGLPCTLPGLASLAWPAWSSAPAFQE